MVSLIIKKILRSKDTIKLTNTESIPREVTTMTLQSVLDQGSSTFSILPVANSFNKYLTYGKTFEIKDYKLYSNNSPGT